MKTVAIIPARYASTRFPGKPLTKISGITMIERVYRQTSLAKSVSSVLVATGDARLVEAVDAVGGHVVMTRHDHRSGTDRLAEVVATQPDIDIIVNVQGDEPLIDPYTIDSAVKPLIADSATEMSTIAAPIVDDAEIGNPNIVKVVLDSYDNALYFSRAAIPFHRDPAAGAPPRYLAHVGLYVYRRQTLLKLAQLAPTPLEQAGIARTAARSGKWHRHQSSYRQLSPDCRGPAGRRGHCRTCAGCSAALSLLNCR